MKFFKFSTSQYYYKVSLERIPLQTLKKYIITQKEYAAYLLNKKIITESQSKFEIKDILKDFKQHCSHSMLRVGKENSKTLEIEEYLFPITDSEKKVTILPSLSEKGLGEKAKDFNVIKITDDLYITSHSLIQETDLKGYFQELKYDSVKNYYVDINTNEFKNLTKENVAKMCQKVVERLESSDTKISKIDINTSADVINDVAALKYLKEYKKGLFEKKTYNEIDQEMYILDVKFTEIENQVKEYPLKRVKDQENSESNDSDYNRNKEKEDL